MILDHEHQHHPDMRVPREIAPAVVWARWACVASVAGIALILVHSITRVLW